MIRELGKLKCLEQEKKVFFYLKISVRQKDSKKHFLGDLSNK